MSAGYSRSPGREDSTNLRRCPGMLAFLKPVTYRWGPGTFHGPLIAARVPLLSPSPCLQPGSQCSLGIGVWRERGESWRQRRD